MISAHSSRPVSCDSLLCSAPSVSLCPLRYAFALLLLVLFCSTSASAEYAVLRNGQRLHIAGYERVGDTVRLTVQGGSISIRADELQAIEPEDIFDPIPAPPAPVAPYAEIIRAAAAASGLDEHLIASVIAAESDFNPRAVSRKGAQGLMQLMPATVARFAVANGFDPAENILTGTRYLKELLVLYRGDVTLALAAYNAGPERVEQYRGVPPYAETRGYLRRVAREYQNRKKGQG